MNALRLALDAVVAAESEYKTRCLVVWHELKAADPALAEEILRLGFDEPTAAQWVCSPFRELGDSPAALVAAGRSTEIMDRVYRTMHGFIG
ncbi:hypothetical protein V3390_07585 [Luteimonas sp. FXH3W]|uniref:Antitoxin Xre/MbcA/ParS-like toxin-binding domain-containing protein n=1 Tax=Aquilutibacter rugosus TaxID=3115820 RepID=A0ABU7UZW9_9GAMM